MALGLCLEYLAFPLLLLSLRYFLTVVIGVITFYAETVDWERGVSGTTKCGSINDKNDCSIEAGNNTGFLGSIKREHDAHYWNIAVLCYNYLHAENISLQVRQFIEEKSL
ncbi:MAG: hypothetical protein A6F71_10260 [Cycloclasticus sp. symbiont of Poecilosclerida sp. M]|nr:MAG: hypothetical protein A6F71_10260 [Cycloclasticus sp. symbiont of Poecilosclerida sp. M]